jgi:NAD(P)-dependent dehydrogenase (short-subunit alcohol dehydrogenase family)
MSTILITGGAKRIGRSIALYLAKRGYDLAIHYNQSQSEALTLQQEIQELGQTCHLFQASLTGKETDAELLLTNVLNQCPTLYGLINNASTFTAASLVETNEVLLQNQFSDNLNNALWLSKQFYKLVKNGVIVNILDTYIHKNPFNHTAYILAKKSLAELTKLNAREFGPNIRVNAIAPGLILPSNHEEEVLFEKLLPATPLQRAGQPNDVAHAIKFLLTNHYITGQIINIDGGKSLI